MTVRGAQHVLFNGLVDAYPVGPVPPGGTKTTKIAEKTITTTAGRPVMFTAKARFQAQHPDSGIALLYIAIDGTSLGSYGVQGISPVSGESQRTLSAGYLATSLASGSHTVQVYMQVQGTFDSTNNGPFIHTEIPLVYFD